MSTAKEVQENLEFKTVKDGLVSYQIRNNANSDSWKTILVIFNAQNKIINYKLDQSWKVAVFKDSFDFEGKESVSENLKVPGVSMVVLFED